MTFRIGYLVFPDITQLDLTGPQQVLARVPGAEQLLVWKTREPVRSESGLMLIPDTTYAECPPLDMICVPGGPGMNALLTDADTIAFLQRLAPNAKYITAVCTGSLVLGAAGLLKGKRAATHWAAMEFLPRFGATPVEERVVVDGNIITGGGVTAGIDFGLKVAAEVAGEQMAKAIQLMVEYDPDPPFDSGHPRSADPAMLAMLRERMQPMHAHRSAQVDAAAAKLR
jgi:cyclohexyl-isocyanide hydratase